MRIAKRIFTSLTTIIAVGFAIRVMYFFHMQIHLKAPIIANLPFGYETGRIARSIALGNGYSSPLAVQSGPTAWLTPVFPYLLAGVMKLFGVYTYKSMVSITILDDVFSVLTCIPIYFIGKRLSGTGLAVGAAWMWAFFPNAILIPLEWIWDTSLTALAMAVILWATLEIVDSERLRDWIGYGLLWGAGLMINASLLSIAPFLLGWLAWQLRKRTRRWFQLPALATAFMVLACVPWTARNYIVFHEFIPLRSNFGLELWLGNNDQVPDTWASFLHPNDYPPEREKYVRLGEIEYMKEKQHEAIQFMETHPRDTLRFFWRRFVDNWIGAWDPIQDIWPTLSGEGRFKILSNIFVTIFGFLGLLFMFREKTPFAFPIAMLPLVYPIVYYITHTSLRYRHPIDPALMVMSAFAFAYPARVWARRKAVHSVPSTANARTDISVAL
jgi:4-amino-4-deoxy-L-arabinose transferase-like glycosyltransferase